MTEIFLIFSGYSSHMEMIFIYFSQSHHQTKPLSLSRLNIHEDTDSSNMLILSMLGMRHAY